jgi:hypothetical protein
MATARNTGVMMDAYSTYRWPRGTPLFSLIGLYALGFLMAAQPSLTHLPAGKVVVALYFFAATLFCIYLYSFRVILDRTSIRAGAVFLKKIEFADIVRTTYLPHNDGGQVILHASHGKRIRIWETIENFGDCVVAINAGLPAHLLISRVERTAPIDAPGSGDQV